MTKKQRAQVVELLRCAADQAVDGAGFFIAQGGIGYPKRHPVERLAWNARCDVLRESEHGLFGHANAKTEKYRALLLEAAARVEEGSWP